MNLGILILICANAALLQDRFKQENVHAQHQKHNGMPTLRHAAVHQTLLETIVNLAPHQDSGISTKRNACVLHQKLNGTHPLKSANAQPVNMETSVLNVQHQDIGILSKMLAFALPQGQYGT